MHDGKEFMSNSEMQSFFAHHGGFGGGAPIHGPGMHDGAHAVIRPMPNIASIASINSEAAINSMYVGGGHPMGMQYLASSSPPMPRNNVNSGGLAVPGTVPVEPGKRKRGRPRKYASDGSMSLKTPPPPPPPPQSSTNSAPPMGSVPGASSFVPASGFEDASPKKRRGRPPGTGRKQQLASMGNLFSGSAGTCFMPHVITVSEAEDIVEKISAFSNEGERAVCILSAKGTVSKAIVRQWRTPQSGTAIARYDIVSYEGSFEILSLSGSYNLNDGSQNQTGSLSVTLSDPDGSVVGGVLSGNLIAASTVQVILGSFLSMGTKSKAKKAGKQTDFSTDSFTGGQDMSTSSGPNQNLTPSVSGGWPGSGIFDTRNSNIDINSSRG